MWRVNYLLLPLLILCICVNAQKPVTPRLIERGGYKCWYIDSNYSEVYDVSALEPYYETGILFKDSIFIVKGNKKLNLACIFSDCGIKQAMIINCKFTMADTITGIKPRRVFPVIILRMDTLKGRFSVMHKTVFEKNISISNCSISDFSMGDSVYFMNGLTLTNSRINNIDFNNSFFYGTVDFRRTIFTNTVDLRRCDFRKVRNVYLENLNYPDGKFLFNWEQLRAKEDEFRIKLGNPSVKDQWDNYKRLIGIYERLRDNYVTQDKKNDADNIMYELAEYKDKLVGTIYTRLYGIFLGYGYKPWQFLLLLVLPVILLGAVIYYYFYYGIVVRIVSPKYKKDGAPQLVTPAFEIPVYKKFKIHVYNHKGIFPQIRVVEKLWQAVYFSSSVLLSFKFKNDWLADVPEETPGKKSFLLFVSFNWLLGILLYVIFGLFVLSTQFGFVKGLLGI